MYLFIYIKSRPFKFEDYRWTIDECFKYTYLKYIRDLNFQLRLRDPRQQKNYLKESVINKI